MPRALRLRMRRVLGSLHRHHTLILFGVMHLLCGLAIVYPPTAALLLLAGGSYLLRMWGTTAGYHRYFAHRSYRTSRVFQFFLAFVGATAMQNGPLWWASWHRRHHKVADRPGDPHSPLLTGFWYAHFYWVFSEKRPTDVASVPDLARFPELRFLDRNPWLPLFIYALGCYAILGTAGVVWGFVISTVVANHATFLINSLAHVWGTRRFETPDESRNNAFLAVLTLGEGWHNNHHRYMSSVRQGLVWWELDLSYASLKLLSWLGVVWDLRAPPERGRWRDVPAPGPSPNRVGEKV